MLDDGAVFFKYALYDLIKNGLNPVNIACCIIYRLTGISKHLYDNKTLEHTKINFRNNYTFPINYSYWVRTTCIYLRNLLTHTVNSLLQKHNYIKQFYYSVFKHKCSIIHIMCEKFQNNSLCIMQNTANLI